MTKQEILDGLEGLKDLVNHIGKSQIDNLKAAVMGLEEPSKPEEVAPVPPQPEEEKPFVSGGRFAEKKSVPHGTKRKR